MRVAIIHSSDNKSMGIAKGLEQALSKENCRADLLSTSSSSSTPLSTSPYQLICVVSGFSGLFKPRMPIEVDSALKRCTRLEGKKGVAVVPAGFGSVKALRVLMGMLEKQGVIVEDFAAVKAGADIPNLASRLRKLLK